MANTKKSNRGGMTNEHKAALAKGREEGLAVRRYLEALETSRPRRGRRRTPASITKRLTAVETELASADPLTRLHLLQEQKDLQDELARSADQADISGLEKRFVKVARSYGERKHISTGPGGRPVSAAVLQRGLARSSRS